MYWTNYHSHCLYCDGSDEPEAYIQEAIKQGFVAYGFSSHAPLPFTTTWSMHTEKLPAYIFEIARLKDVYQPAIQVYTSLEVDFIPGVIGPKSTFIVDAGLDYTIGSVHFVDAFFNGQPWEIDSTLTIFQKGLQDIFKGDIRAAVKRYFELTRQMVQEECPDIIGHLDKIKMQNTRFPFFSENEVWYKEEVIKTLQVIAEAKAIVEVNTRGLYQKKTTDVYPSRWILDQIQRLHIPVTINSDAHKPNEIASQFEPTAQLLQKTGFKELHVLLDGKWQPRPLTNMEL